MLLQPLPKPLSGCTFSSLLHFVGSPVIAGTLRGLSRLWSPLAYIRAQSQSWGSLNLSLCSLRTVLKVISISSSFLPACCEAQLYLNHTCSYVLILPHCSSPPYGHHTTGYRCDHFGCYSTLPPHSQQFRSPLWISWFFKISNSRLSGTSQLLFDSFRWYKNVPNSNLVICFPLGVDDAYHMWGVLFVLTVPDNAYYNNTTVQLSCSHFTSATSYKIPISTQLDLPNWK